MVGQRARACARACRATGMNSCPPQPGLTLMHRARSSSSCGDLVQTGRRRGGADRGARGAPGLADRPKRVVHVRGRLDVDRDAVRARPGDLGRRSDRAARSSGARRGSRPRAWTCSASAPTISAPKVIGGTKWPSITSTWITRAPAARTSSTWAPSRAKSADRIDGATRGSRSSAAVVPAAEPVRSSHRLDRPQHAALAVVAGDDRRARHAHDRRVLAAVGAHRDELVALQAVDAAVAPGHRGGAQPRLAASRALRTELGQGSVTVRLT